MRGFEFVEEEGIRGFFLQAEDGMRDAQEARGMGDVYKGKGPGWAGPGWPGQTEPGQASWLGQARRAGQGRASLVI